MGFYLQDPNGSSPLGWLRDNARHELLTKEQLVEQHSAVALLRHILGEGDALIACIDNGPFQAALIINGWGDLHAVSQPGDQRPVSFWRVSFQQLGALGHDPSDIFRDFR